MVDLLQPSSSSASRPNLSLDDLDARVRFLRESAIEKSTRANYNTGARSYISFCEKFALPLDPSPSTLARYIAFTSLSIASGPKYLSGAKHHLQHTYPDFDSSRSSPLVQAVIAGSKKVRADPVRRKLPVRTHHLQAFEEKYSLPTYDNILFLTMFACGFYACHRAGELFVRSTSSLDFRKLIKRSSLKFTAHHASYNLPYHKTDRFYRGTEILHGDQAILNPRKLLLKYTTIRDKMFGGRSALFIRADGSIPTRTWFETQIFSILGKEYGGHSLRAGGATFYASLGLSETVIQALGRWSSSAWKIYIRENPTIRAELELAQARWRNPHS